MVYESVNLMMLKQKNIEDWSEEQIYFNYSQMSRFLWIWSWITVNTATVFRLFLCLKLFLVSDQILFLLENIDIFYLITYGTYWSLYCMKLKITALLAGFFLSCSSCFFKLWNPQPSLIPGAIITARFPRILLLLPIMRAITKLLRRLKLHSVTTSGLTVPPKIVARRRSCRVRRYTWLTTMLLCWRGSGARWVRRSVSRYRVRGGYNLLVIRILLVLLRRSSRTRWTLFSHPLRRFLEKLFCCVHSFSKVWEFWGACFCIRQRA